MEEQIQSIDTNMVGQDGDNTRDTSGEEDFTKEADFDNAQREIDIIQLKEIIESEEKLNEKIKDMNDYAALKIMNGDQKEAIMILQQAEQILEYAASCGKVIDRNLIIVVLYNRACAYQGLWILDKCSKYLEGVLFNIEASLKEDQVYEIRKDQKMNKDKDSISYRVKRQVFLVKSYLQYCAILSQLGQHQQALDMAQKCVSILKDIFHGCFTFCQETIKSNESSASSASTAATKSQKYTQFKIIKKPQNMIDNFIMTEEQGQRIRQVQQIKEDVQFSKVVFDSAFEILSQLKTLYNVEDITLEEHLQDAKKSLYFWKNNPENNERHLRQELNAPIKSNEDEQRSLLGVQNAMEWIETFNIGSIMHMSSVSYEEFSLFGDIIYEISKKQLLEKIIFLSISYFTIATEYRFMEQDKQPKQNNKMDNMQIKTQQYQLSELYHLKAIEVVCRYITSKSPYINHLITSYHKHYNQNLEIIDEESYCSNTNEANYIISTGYNNKHSNYNLSNQRMVATEPDQFNQESTEEIIYDQNNSANYNYNNDNNKYIQNNINGGGHGNQQNIQLTEKQIQQQFKKEQKKQQNYNNNYSNNNNGILATQPVPQQQRKNPSPKQEAKLFKKNITYANKMFSYLSELDKCKIMQKCNLNQAHRNKSPLQESSTNKDTSNNNQLQQKAIKLQLQQQQQIPKQFKDKEEKMYTFRMAATPKQPKDKNVQDQNKQQGQKGLQSQRLLVQQKDEQERILLEKQNNTNKIQGQNNCNTGVLTPSTLEKARINNNHSTNSSNSKQRNAVKCHSANQKRNPENQKTSQFDKTTPALQKDNFLFTIQKPDKKLLDELKARVERKSVNKVTQSMIRTLQRKTITTNNEELITNNIININFNQKQNSGEAQTNRTYKPKYRLAQQAQTSRGANSSSSNNQAINNDRIRYSSRPDTYHDLSQPIHQSKNNGLGNQPQIPQLNLDILGKAFQEVQYYSQREQKKFSQEIFQQLELKKMAQNK